MNEVSKALTTTTYLTRIRPEEKEELEPNVRRAAAMGTLR